LTERGHECVAHGEVLREADGVSAEGLLEAASEVAGEERIIDVLVQEGCTAAPLL
jgi:hypothetical protein